MEFRLLFQGELFANGNRKHKHSIRCQFHSQLRRLWETHPALSFMLKHGIHLLEIDPLGGGTTGPWKLDGYADHFKVGGFRFVPLISNYFSTVCALDILLLKPEGTEPTVSKTGDLDNRIKTLFDALRVPRADDPQEISGLSPSPGEDPFFCLLEDDSLINGFKVTGDRLLAVPTGCGHPMNYAVVVIDVVVKLVRSMPLSQAFL